jgi:hypothetical protein
LIEGNAHSHSDVNPGLGSLRPDRSNAAGRRNHWPQHNYDATDHNEHNDLLYGHINLHVNVKHDHDVNVVQYIFDNYDHDVNVHKLELYDDCLDYEHVNVNLHNLLEHVHIPLNIDFCSSNHNDVDHVNNINSNYS